MRIAPLACKTFSPRIRINYDALFRDGILSRTKGDAAKAIREFEYLSNTYRQNPQVRYQLALAYLLSAKKHQRARKAAMP